jgi:hypothetical protein
LRWILHLLLRRFQRMVRRVKSTFSQLHSGIWRWMDQNWNGDGMAQYQEWIKSGRRSPASRRCLQDVKVSCNHNIMLGELVFGTRNNLLQRGQNRRDWRPCVNLDSPRGRMPWCLTSQNRFIRNLSFIPTNSGYHNSQTYMYQDGPPALSSLLSL